jgi:hypothetical protein
VEKEMSNKVITVLTVGNPGATACATIDVLDRDIWEPVCDDIMEEIIDDQNKHYFFVTSGGVPVIDDLGKYVVVRKEEYGND